MRFFTAILAVFLSITAAFAAELSEKDRSDIRSAVVAVMTRVNAGDPDAIVDVMPQSAIDLFGGRDALKRMTAETYAQQKARNMVFEKFDAGQVSEPVMAGDTIIVFVPTEVAVKIGDKQMAGTGFMIASREKGSDQWKLLGGDGIASDPALLPKIYKGFPSGVTLPPVKFNFK